MEKIFRIQKHCIRILFGDLHKYKNKQKTCARTRPFGEQKLGSEFYCKEHTKPLFHETKILAVYIQHLQLSNMLRNFENIKIPTTIIYLSTI